MDINNIPIKQNANQVTDPNTQVSAEEFNALVDNAKESVTSMEVLAGKEEVKLSYGKGKGTSSALTFPTATAAGAGMMSPKQAARIADRTATDGMGYVVLDKDKTFAEQVTQENTIYEIRYEFDLGEKPNKILAGCVLKFEGGKLKNGTIEGEDFDILSTNVCLENVKFLGGVVNCKKFKIDWWVSQYGTSIEDNPSYDSSPEINDAVSSGVHNLVFSSERFYYLKDAIRINGYVNLYSDHELKEFDTPYRGTTGHLPSIYSNEIVTMLDYNFSGENDHRTTLTIGHINFFCTKKYSDLSDKEVPIVSIISQSSLWGLSFSANINAVDCPINEDYIFNYTGLLLKTGSGNMTFVKINGYIQKCYCCIRTEAGSGWFTDLTINGDTRGCIGGIFNGGSPVRIFGSHQPEYVYPEVAAANGYFNGSWINLYGFVWDCNITKGSLKTVRVPVLMTKEDFFYNSELGDASVGRPLGALLREHSSLKFRTSDNMLELLRNQGINNITYKLNGTDITNHPDGVLYNSYNLYNNGVMPGITSSHGLSAIYSDLCSFKANKAVRGSLVLDFDVNPNYFEDRENGSLSLLLRHSNQFSVYISDKEGNSIYSHTVTYNDIYYTNRYFECRIPRSTDIVHVSVDFSFDAASGGYTGLPIIFMPMLRPTYPHIARVTKTTRPTVRDSFQRTLPFYDTTIGKPIWWNGSTWIDATGGNPDNITSGAFADKPSSPNIGFAYFCTDRQTAEGATNGIMIYYKGENVWVDALGRVLEQ